MAAPTSISVLLDLDEYSKFERDRDTITLSYTASGGGDMSSEVLKIDLIKARRSRDSIVYTTTTTISGTSDPISGSTIIYLPDVVDSDYINLIRRGYYFVRISSVTDPSVYIDSVDFPISIVSAQRLRDSYLFGLTLAANDIQIVKFQPANITGVEVLSLSIGHPASFYPLTYIYNGSVRQLAWGGGPVVTVTQPGQYFLKFDCTGKDYMVVRIRSISALPVTNQTDELFVEGKSISDDMLRVWIEQACDWLENDKLAGVFLEPTRITTEPEDQYGTDLDWDYIVPPITFYPTTPARWIDILFPYQWLLRINELFGQLANTRIVNVSNTWVEIAERSGFVQLCPFNATSAFEFIGLVWVESLRGKIELPNFWHFDAVAGLRKTDPVLLEIISKKASIDALTVAGHAFRGGFASQSISRDGVSESVSYTASAIYGIYSATIEDYNKFINREIKQLRGRYRGVNMLVC